jgi:hypothetical protein
VLASGSAIGYYGSRGEESLTEASAPGDDFLATVCVEWENAANVAVKSGTPVAILRTGIVMDKSGGALKKQLLVFRLGLGGKLGSGAQWLSPISLNDEIRAILWVLDNKLSGPFNLTSPKPLRNIDFTRQLGDALHRPTIVTAPAFALRIALGREMADEVLLTSQKVLPEALLESGFIFNDSESASMLQQ